MSEGTLARPRPGVAKMPEVSGSTGQVAGNAEKLTGGVYKHPQTGQEIIALDDPITGDAQARGYVRVGFVYERDIKPGDVKEIGLEQPSENFAKQPERKLEASDDELKGLRARLNALEAAADKRKEADVQVDGPAEESQKHAQESAKEQTEARGLDNSGQVDANGVNATVVPSTDSKEATTSKKESK